ncbi:hypothetical protein [Haloplanus halophilus]|uniref:hypothetical protein n=1 Tax=Haloplanus halophilus TaxID=2949993 RepID=UPI002040E11B|nr:hypothetical protein [Haloplanus sp. GDY1]
MRGYLSAADADGGRIPLDSRTELYRKADENNRVVAESEGTVRPLGVADATVSRKTDGRAPVTLVPRSEFVEIRNDGNTNGVTVTTGGDEFDVEEGFVETVARDATITLGYRTTLRLTVEREASVERNVVHQGEGDVVVGDQTNVDRSRTVGDDNVINRSLGGDGDGAADAVDTSERGGSGPSYCVDCGAKLTGDGACPECDRGDATDTRQFCERHQRTYVGDACPECRRSA